MENIKLYGLDIPDTYVNCVRVYEKSPTLRNVCKSYCILDYLRTVVNLVHGNVVLKN